jgi:hypothetical protein
MMASSEFPIQLDPLNDDDPFFLSFFAELPNRIEIDAPAPGGEEPLAPATKKRKASSSSSSSSSSSGTISNVQGTAIQEQSDQHLSAETCRFVTSRGEVRGDTLTSMERLANVVADKIQSCGDPSVQATNVERVSRTAEDVELAKVPTKIYEAVTGMDKKLTRCLIEAHFDEGITFISTTTDQPIAGRENLYQFICKTAQSTPDMVGVVRHSRVVVDEAGNKAVKFKTFTTGTYMMPKSSSVDAVPNFHASSVVKQLDEASISKKDVASIKRAFRSPNDTESFTYLVHGATCWHLNKEGKVQHIDDVSKVLNMKPWKDGKVIK